MQVRFESEMKYKPDSVKYNPFSYFSVVHGAFIKMVKLWNRQGGIGIATIANPCINYTTTVLNMQH
jgi:hypothetical protein